MFTGPEWTVVVQGSMFDTITPRLCLYAGMFGRAEGLAVRSVTDAWEARFRARRYEYTVVSDSIADTKKKSRTRKTKKDEKPTEEMA
jgi:hypothetical protein